MDKNINKEKNNSDLIIGIDDAGRGPVIGSMFLAGVLVTREQEIFLKGQNVKDSKLLLHPARIRLSRLIEENSIAHKVVEASPEEIDSAVKTSSLNILEARKMAEVIDFLKEEAGSENDKINVIVDCPSVNIPAWTETLASFVKNIKNTCIKCEHKADVNHISVSAASILAKVAREENVEKIKKEIGIDFGSGYPADPKTKAFLDKHWEKFENSGLIRKSWETWNTLMKKKGQKQLF